MHEGRGEVALAKEQELLHRLTMPHQAEFVEHKATQACIHKLAGSFDLLIQSLTWLSLLHPHTFEDNAASCAKSKR